MAALNRIRTRGAVGGRRALLGLLGLLELLVLVNAREANPAQSVPDGSDTPGSGATALGANGIEAAAGLAALFEFFYSRLRAARQRGGVAIVGGACSGAAQRCFRGLPWWPAMEPRRGAAARVARTGSVVDSTAFRHAYVSGQVLLITSFHGRFPPGAWTGRTQLTGRLTSL
jgi:hypothetical protein